MKVFLAVALLAATGCFGQLFPGPGGNVTSVGSSYTYNKTITVDHTKVPSTLTNFPMLFTTTDANLKATGSGGSVTDAQGDDIVLGTAAGCGTPLSYNLERWVSTTGEVQMWVKIASLSSTVDNVIYLCAGNAAITTFQGGSAGAAWDSDFVTVYHVSDGTTLSMADSTSNAYTATNSSATAGAGKIDGGMTTSGTQHATSPTVTGMNTALTLSAWVKTSTTGAFQFAISAVTATPSEYEVGIDSSNHGVWNFGYPNGTGTQNGSGSTTLTDGAWHYLVLTFRTIGSGGDGKGRLYVDGSVVSTGASATNFPDTITSFSMNNRQGDTSFPLVGTSDELRVSKTDRSADWIMTEWNNQNSPGTFYSIT